MNVPAAWMPVAEVPDRDARHRALAPESSFIVQAPAGSGKTELLIQRFLVLLAKVRNPEEVVAITFTKKAAGEMRERVIESLRSAALGAEPTSSRSDPEGKRMQLARSVVARDQRFDWRLLDHPARLKIQTIDSLCLALTRQMPWLSGFAGPFSLIEDASLLYREASIQTLRLVTAQNHRWRESIYRFLAHLDNRFGRAVDLLSDMLSHRDQWLRYVGGELPQAHIDAAWQQVSLRILRQLGKQAGRYKNDLLLCADVAASRLGASPEQSPDNHWLSSADLPPASIQSLPCWRFLADLLLTKSGHWRKQLTITHGFPPGSREKQVASRLLAGLQDDERFRQTLRDLRDLPGPGLSDDQLEVMESTFEVLKLAAAQLRVLFEARNQADFIELNLRAAEALGRLGDPSDLALKLDYTIRHLLVDEFQDTSIGQFELIRSLIQGWSPDDGRTLLLVGDPMQSIYRFRQAEVGVFLRVLEEGIGDIPLEHLCLSVNFRSNNKLVGWVNRRFRKVFPDKSDPFRGAVSYAPSEALIQASGKDPAVLVHPLVDATAEEEAERVADIIQRSRTTPGRDIAVLVRARPHLAAILPALSARGIPYSGVEIVPLLDEPVVRDLLSLTRALIHPGDRLAWLSILRAPWCGLTLSDLLLVAADDSGGIWTSLQKAGKCPDLSADGQRRLRRLVTIMSPTLEQRGRLMLNAWVRRAWVSLDGPAVIGPADREHAEAFFALLQRHEGGDGLQDEQAFLRAIENHWAKSETHDDAVKVMTIHRAKGLEFDQVIIPGVDRAPPREDQKLLLWEEQADGSGLLLASQSAVGSDGDPHYRFLYRQQSLKSRHEGERLFYVACTRARESLHLIGNANSADGGGLKKPEANSFLSRIWSSLEPQFEQAGSPQRGLFDSGGRGSPVFLRRIHSHYRSPPAKPLDAQPKTPPLSEPLEFSWAGESARCVGLLAHELAQQIAEQGLTAWDSARIEDCRANWRRRLRHMGVSEEDLSVAVERTAECVRNLLTDPRSQWLLTRPGAENELELEVYRENRLQRFRVDRTFVDTDGVRWIVDYKTGSHGGGGVDEFLDREVERYRGQLESYAAAFSEMEGGELRIGLYFPLLRGWREWEYTG